MAAIQTGKYLRQVAVIAYCILLIFSGAVWADRIKDLASVQGIRNNQLVGYGLIIGIATWLALSAAGRIGKFMGQTGINVMTRLMGLILAAIAVEVMSDGLIKLFPALSH